ncbi:MAG: TIGR01777 family protein [Saccharospirillaceae bacterium]|nr:TIGR01777 family oxidoreductase [Pseudomonadales bacterium]NRB79239.1 TIGR01777 family protein [Saccharospirillaceae bacterium]
MPFNRFQIRLYRWLLFIGISHAILGIVFIFIANTSLIQPYLNTVFATFAVEDTPNNSALFSSFLQFFGPTISSWGILLCISVFHYYHFGNLRTKIIISAALLIWFILDSGLSILNGFYTHLIINSLAFFAFFPAFLLLKTNSINNPSNNTLTIFDRYKKNNKTILITGGTGFIGKRLVQTLKHLDHNIYVLTRSPSKYSNESKLHYIQSLNDIHNKLNIDVIINLAGESLASGRWTKKQKERFLDSRIQSTKTIEQLVTRLHVKPELLINGSAIGFYGAQQDEELDEQSTFTDCFSHQLCKQWEQTALTLKQHNVRVCLLRIGIVLGNNGGPLAQLRLPFEFGVLMQIGNGKQWMSWIHRDDLISMMLYCIENTQLNGPINGTAPQPVTNQVFAQRLSQHIKTIVKIVVPAKLLSIIVGELADEVLITGQRVIPKKMQDNDFEFNYPDLDSALKQIIDIR